MMKTTWVLREMTQFNVIQRNRRTLEAACNSLYTLHLWLFFCYVNARDSVIGATNWQIQLSRGDSSHSGVTPNTSCVDSLRNRPDHAYITATPNEVNSYE